MILYLAGTCHPDPLGRERTVKWLKKLKESLALPPDFIATESKHALIQKIYSQREILKQKIEEKWSGITVSLLSDLSTTLCYEFDAHNEIFPDVDHTRR